MPLDLRTLDDVVGGGARDADAGRLPAGDPLAGISNGFHTLTFPDGSHRTFRVRTERNGKLAGNRTVAMLIGPANTADYEAFGFVDDVGITVWKRFRGQRQERYAGLLWRLADGEVMDGHELETSRRCFVCNRELTTPESMADGVGPTCKARLREGR